MIVKFNLTKTKKILHKIQKTEIKIINLNLTVCYKVNLCGKSQHRKFKLKGNMDFLIINNLSFT